AAAPAGTAMGVRMDLAAERLLLAPPEASRIGNVPIVVRQSLVAGRAVTACGRRRGCVDVARPALIGVAEGECALPYRLPWIEHVALTHRQRARRECVHDGEAKEGGRKQGDSGSVGSESRASGLPANQLTGAPWERHRATSLSSTAVSLRTGWPGRNG